ncbi:putative mucin-19-like [Triplophysa rosa]|uniref:protein-tyrosine-phosphatase n=1 Tax=Triplophysa rosa TaxID=992332 RepID=A0A9W7X0U6_TRIRA|nr:putative mucin-19-like [Triplophysa rosa]
MGCLALITACKGTALLFCVILQVLNAENSTTVESNTAPPVDTSTSSTETPTSTATTHDTTTAPPVTTSTSSTESQTSTTTTVESTTAPPVDTSTSSTESPTSTATTVEITTAPPVNTSTFLPTSTATTLDTTTATPVTTSASLAESQTSTATTVESTTAPPVNTSTSSTESPTSTATTVESTTAPPFKTSTSAQSQTSTATTLDTTTAPPVDTSTSLPTSTATKLDTITAPSVNTSTSSTESQTTSTTLDTTTSPPVNTSTSAQSQTSTATTFESTTAPPVYRSASSTESPISTATTLGTTTAPPVNTSTSLPTSTATTLGTTTAPPVDTSTSLPTSTATTLDTTTAPPVDTSTSSTATTVERTTAPPGDTSTSLPTATRPDVIRNLTASEISTSSVLLKWDKPLGDGFSFKVQWTGDGTGVKVTNDTFYKITGLTPGVQYTFKITAVAADNLTEGDPFDFSTCTKPEVIRNLQASKIKTTSVFLKWEEPVGNRSFFKVQRTKKDRSDSSTVIDTYLSFTDLNPGVTYEFCIRAVATDNNTEGELICILVTTEGPDNTGMIVGITLGLFCFIIIIILILFIYTRRRTKPREYPTDIPIDNISSTALRMEDYEEYYRRKHADSNCGFAEEYEELKTVGTAQAKNSALAIENKAKNRYNDVLPYDASRVKLSMCGNPFEDYINANYIPGYNSRKEFIAAQGPLPITVNEFWRMIWEKNVCTLVMLTKCKEQGRVKCEKYWPSGTSHYHNISVTITSEIPLECWTIRDFSVKNVKTAETRNVRQFHFTAWPDHGVPQSTELLNDFRHVVREHIDQYSRHSPTIVHCSAGVGRTGTFIAIDRLIFQIERESMVDVYGIVHDMRMHRPFMVQTEAQYVYLQQCANDMIRSRTGTNVDLIYQNPEALHTYVNFPVKNAN